MFTPKEDLVCTHCLKTLKDKRSVAWKPIFSKKGKLDCFFLWCMSCLKEEGTTDFKKY